MYEIRERTIEVLSLALHDLSLNPISGPAALRELARLIRLHGGIRMKQTKDDGACTQIELGDSHPIHSPDEVHVQNKAQVIDRIPQEVERESRLAAIDVAWEYLEDPREIDIIFVIGGPGSGKGTICEKLASAHEFKHVSVGELLRSEVRSGSALGNQVAEIMRSGTLVSDGLILDVVHRYLANLISETSGPLRVLMDGFPRTVEQAIAFEKLIRPPSKIMWFSCDDSILIQRILSRGETSGRADDNTESANQRLLSFHAATSKIHEYFSENCGGALISIDASQTIDEVYINVKNALAL